MDRSQKHKLFLCQLIFGLCFLFQCPALLLGQNLLIEDAQAVDSIKKAVALTYNFQFEASEKTAAFLSKKYQSHPGVKLYECINQFWKYFPISSHPILFETYKRNLTKVLETSEKLLESNKNNAEATFFCLLVNMMIGRHQAEDGNYLKAVNAMRKAYNYLKQGEKFQSRYEDFYFTTGLYNYYRVAYPEAHPMYKPFLSFFPDGNKVLGIKQMDIAAQKAMFVVPEALSFLIVIHLRYENKKEKGMTYANQLFALFPENPVYKILYAEALLMNGQYEDAVPVVNQIIKSNLKMAVVPAILYKALLEEKLHGKKEEAKTLFLKATSYKPNKANQNYIGLAYYYLAKLNAADTKQSKDYYKQALKYCEYRNIQEECKANL